MALAFLNVAFAGVFDHLTLSVRQTDRAEAGHLSP